MILKVVNSSSKGNSFILEGTNQTLLLECGVPFHLIKKHLGFNLRNVVGCLVTHEHRDHSKAIVDVARNGINVYASSGTFSCFLEVPRHRKKVIKPKTKFRVGEFQIMPFDIKHDANEPLGFLIYHKECGYTLFLTDTFYSPYKFKGLNNVIIECNYSQEIVDEKVSQDAVNHIVRDRVLASHMSLENCIKTLLANDLDAVENIVLTHLSNTNSDEDLFRDRVYAATGKNVVVAKAGVELNFNKEPF